MEMKIELNMGSFIFGLSATIVTAVQEGSRKENTAGHLDSPVDHHLLFSIASKHNPEARELLPLFHWSCIYLQGTADGERESTTPLNLDMFTSASATSHCELFQCTLKISFQLDERCLKRWLYDRIRFGIPALLH
ncbi:unnamed protein product [Soboliphyme baturini]|uniref:Secreted protein n=1 Tax=Soboliphyme baturini TaxID=241478 RepID=A0A183J6E5_9BILA|nr:unnamed protein product [Soboliphyme baturini]